MKILLNNHTLQKTLKPFDNIGFIPTMGGIHEGHISLIKKSIKLSQKTIVSIFVNPKQFNSKKDFKSYPSNIKRDLAMLKKNHNIDFIYVPKFNEIYKNKKQSKIKINKNDKILCAKFRKGHFEGVLDVMDRLTNLIKPRRIFMGKKDFQQLYLVKNFIEKKYPSKVIGCKTIRNKNKLALSSRNFLFNKNDLNQVEIITSKFFQLKKKIKEKKQIHKFLQTSKKELEKLFKIKIEYLENRSNKNLVLSNNYLRSRIFLSYYYKGIRLIDNF
jgi:pantoate--beta-alanine ligase